MSQRIPAITQKQAAAFLQSRPRDSHKGQFGTVTVIGGASGMVGAALLAGRAALKLGAGCVHVGLLAEGAPVVDVVQPELMLHQAHDAIRLCIDSAQDTKNIVIPAKAGIQPDKNTGFPLSRERQKMALAIGCGLGTSLAAQKLLTAALRLNTPLVLDADALNLLARHPDLQDDLRKRHAASVITPHPGEAARLLGIGTAEVQAARTESAQRLAQQLHCSVVLKGADSVCVTRAGKTYLNKTGNPGMSAPGMGDVLTGMIAAFIAQGLDADQALLLAVHLHGAAGDALAEKGVAVGMTATDVTEWARWLLNQETLKHA
ncbi:MAG: NAD(P)H-hydrate dehydratase [Nitrosomonadales bacterium]|nr:NAD(P)H-hydrate dehydratase [Nitrosomonadales bacterium]